MKFNLITFSLAILGIVIVFYLSRITGQLANLTNSYKYFGLIDLIFYGFFIFILLYSFYKEK